MNWKNADIRVESAVEAIKFLLNSKHKTQGMKVNIADNAVVSIQVSAGARTCVKKGTPTFTEATTYSIQKSRGSDMKLLMKPYNIKHKCIIVQNDIRT